MGQIPALVQFAPNTIIKSGEANSNNTNIRNTYNVHDTAVNGVHGIVAGAIMGTAANETVSGNKTFQAEKLKVAGAGAGVVSFQYASSTNNRTCQLRDAGANVDIQTIHVLSKTMILPEYIQDESDFVPTLPVESTWAPDGIVVTKCGIKTDANSTYSVVFEKWTDPQTHSADLATVATSTSDEADSGAITQAVAAGEIVGVDLPTTTGLKWLQVFIEYYLASS